MKIASSLIDSSYSARIEKGASVFKKNPENQPKEKVEEHSDFETVDLTTGFSLEKIQTFLQTEIGKRLDNMMAEAGVDFTAAAGMDWSPDATSGRIFDMATGLFGVWRDQHPDMSEAELIDSFEEVILSSVDKGADEAISLIGAAGFGEDTHEITHQTMTLLHEKLDTYFADLRRQLSEEPV